MVRSRSTFAGSNISQVKKHNLLAILLTFLHHPSISRIQLARHTHLSNTTITNLTAELISQGILVETEDAHREDRSRRRVGRPRRMLRLVPNARYVIGVHIGIGVFRVALTNLHAEIVTNRISPFDVTLPALQVLDEIAGAIRETILESGVDTDLILGVGIGASGLVNHQTGVNVSAARLGWKNVPIRQYLEGQLPLPVCVDNNVRNMALGEAYFGLGRGVEVLAFIYGRIGVGAGFVVNGEVFRGSGAGAGEIGHTIIEPSNGEPCRCGQTGCLETLVAEPFLLRAARHLAQDRHGGALAKALKNHPDDPIEAIFSAARAGDPPTRAMIENQMHYLGVALANLVNVLNPELIILGGMFAQGSDLIMPTVEATMRRLAFAGLGEKVKMVPTGFGWRAGVIGAASLALKVFFYEASRELSVTPG